MQMFTFERSINGVRLIATQGSEVGWDCAGETEVDHLISQIKGDLDKTAAAMKAALKQPYTIFPERPDALRPQRREAPRRRDRCGHADR